MIIVDETSMVDQHIMSLLLKAVQNHTRVVFIGDANQLPSVGSGNVLADIIASKEIPVVKLRVVFRQGQQSPIIKNSRAILKGETELEFTNDFFYKGVQSDMKILSEACKFYVACVNKFGMDNVALLTPLRERTQISVASFNKQLQHYFNPKRDNSLTLKIHDTEFRKGDRIMQIKNTANALNGDIGYIKDIAYAFDPHDEKNFSVVCSVEFNGDGNVLKYTKEDMKNVMLAYAMTVHKSQGSEYETVIFISSDSHSIILRRDLVYTAITRAVKNVAIIGQKQALNDAIMNNNTEMRCTYLKKRIRNVFAKKQQKKGDERHAEQLSVG